MQIDSVMDLFGQYDLHVSGDLGGQGTAWDLIAAVEKDFPVDDIKLADGTRLWNLLRIFIYTFHQEQTGSRGLNPWRFVRDVPLSLIVHQLLVKRVEVQGKDILEDVIDFVCTGIPGRYLDDPLDSSERERFHKACFDYIRVFADMKRYYHKQLLSSGERLVRIGCGYGRFPMAKAQACRELGIKCIEEQHGVIDEFFPAYRRVTPTTNHDCVPEYLEVFDETFKRIVQDGNLFDKEKVILRGQFPMKRYVLFSGQWILAGDTKLFLNHVVRLLDGNWVLMFMPHQEDVNSYSDLDTRIVLVDKDADFFEVLRGVDVHATVFSGRGYYSLVNRKPTIFVDLKKLVKPSDGIVQTPEDFVKAVYHVMES